MLEISHGVGFIKLTMISDKYKHSGILTLISYHLMNEITQLSSENLRYIYAFVASNNYQVLKFIEKYGFRKFGTVPSWDRDESFVIYGRIARNMKDQWKLIEICMDLYAPIIYTMRQTKLKRYIQISSKSYYDFKENIDYKIDFLLNSDVFPHEIIITVDNDQKPIAIVYENKFQKSWFDFHFKKEISYDLKFYVVKELLKKFHKADDINSLSLSVNVNDHVLHKFLLDVGLKYYAYLPFFFIEDKILMGVSKICMEACKVVFLVCVACAED